MSSDRKFIPYARQSIDDDDIEAVVSVLRGNYLTTGPVTEAFEEKFANVAKAQHAVSCSSGTAALHLAALTLNLGPGDKVIVPSITFLATANAARYVGADVIFSDVNSHTGLMESDHLEQSLTRGGDGVTAVFPVHLAGQCPDMASISDIARRKNLYVVEDASHAIGATYFTKGKCVTVGSCSDSDMVTFSFHPVKTIAMGEGGAVTTNNLDYAQRLKLLRNHGMTRKPDSFIHSKMAFDINGAANPWYYEMQEVGFNYRSSDIHCALGLSQLQKLNKFVQRRRQVAVHYDKLLGPLAPLVKPIARNPNCCPAWHLYPVLIDFNQAQISRAELMRQLFDKNIGSQVHYLPVHRQPYYRQLYGDIDLPGAEQYYEHAISLPLYSGMGNEEVEFVVDNLNDILGSP